MLGYRIHCKVPMCGCKYRWTNIRHQIVCLFSNSKCHSTTSRYIFETSAAVLLNKTRRNELLSTPTSRFIEVLTRNLAVSIPCKKLQSMDSGMNIFDRQTKRLQKERASLSLDVQLYDYLKEEVGYRLADRVFDIKRKFSKAVDLGCGRGYVAKHISPESVKELIVCDMSTTALQQLISPDGLAIQKLVVDEENLPFGCESLDLIISSLSLHWVNDLPGTFSQILQSLKNDGVFLAAVFGGDTLFELRCSLQLAELEREGGIAPHISPFTEIRDIGSLLTRAGFTMLTVDTDEVCINYPSMFEVMWDVKGMGENNASWNRKTHLHRETLLAAASIYQHLYGKEDGTVPATFQIIYMVGWKPDKSQPQPLPRGSGEVSLKDLYRLDQIIKETKKIPINDQDK